MLATRAFVKFYDLVCSLKVIMSFVYICDEGIDPSCNKDGTLHYAACRTNFLSFYSIFQSKTLKLKSRNDAK